MRPLERPLTLIREQSLSVDSDWYDYVRDELVDFEERADSLTSDVEVNRARLGPAAGQEERDALRDVHRHLAEAADHLSAARDSLRALRSGGDG